MSGCGEPSPVLELASDATCARRPSTRSSSAASSTSRSPRAGRQLDQLDRPFIGSRPATACEQLLRRAMCLQSRMDDGRSRSRSVPTAGACARMDHSEDGRPRAPSAKPASAARGRRRRIRRHDRASRGAALHGHRRVGRSELEDGCRRARPCSFGKFCESNDAIPGGGSRPNIQAWTGSEFLTFRTHGLSADVGAVYAECCSALSAAPFGAALRVLRGRGRAGL